MVLLDRAIALTFLTITLAAMSLRLPPLLVLIASLFGPATAFFIFAFAVSVSPSFLDSHTIVFNSRLLVTPFNWCVLACLCRRDSLLPTCALLSLGFSKHGLSLAVHSAHNRCHVCIDHAWHEVDHLHIAAYLSWDLFENLLSKITSSDGLLESNKLHDITLRFVVFIVFKQLVI